MSNILKSIFTKEKRQLSPEEYETFANAIIFGQTSFLASYSNLKLSPVFRAVSVISDGIASIPIELYNKVENKYVTNNLTTLLNVRPNIYYSAFTLMKTLVVHLLMYGAAYVHITRIGGEVKDLTLIHPSSVKKQIVDNDIHYNITGKKGFLTSSDVIEILNYTDDCINGVATTKFAVNTLQSLMAEEKHSSSYFKNGGAIAGLVSFSERLTQSQINEASLAIKNANSIENGSSNGIAVLGSDAKYSKIGTEPNNFVIDARGYSLIDIARFFNISPIMLYDLSKSNYSTSEQAKLNFLTDTLMPLMIKIMQEFNYKLFPNKLIERYELRFNEEHFICADLTSKANYYTKLLQTGVMKINEVREALGLPILKEEIADKILLPTNNITPGENTLKNNNTNNEE